MLIGVLIGTLPMSLGYSAGRGWVSPSYVFTWPLLVGVTLVSSGAILLTLAGKGGRKVASQSILVMLAATALSVVGALPETMVCFLNGFQRSVESRIQPAEFQRWAETAGRRIAADTNTAPSSSMLPNGLASIFPKAPYLVAQKIEGRPDADVFVKVVWGGGHWHWFLVYSSDQTNAPASANGRSRSLGHGVTLTTD